MLYKLKDKATIFVLIKNQSQRLFLIVRQTIFFLQMIKRVFWGWKEGRKYFQNSHLGFLKDFLVIIQKMSVTWMQWWKHETEAEVQMSFSYHVVVVSWPHWTPGFPSIPLGGGVPPRPRCQRSVWRRRSRSGHPLETSRCPSRCHDLHTDREHELMQLNRWCRWTKYTEILNEEKYHPSALCFHGRVTRGHSEQCAPDCYLTRRPWKHRRNEFTAAPLTLYMNL